jgi:hypothetical protein
VRYTLTTSVLNVPGVRVMRCWPSWDRPPPGAPRVRIPYCTGLMVRRIIPAPELHYVALAPDAAGDISREPQAFWEERSGNTHGITSVHVAAIGFTEVEAQDAWHAVMITLREAPGWVP